MCVCAAVWGRSFLVVLVAPVVDIRLLNFFFYWRMVLGGGCSFLLSQLSVLLIVCILSRDGCWPLQ